MSNGKSTPAEFSRWDYLSSGMIRQSSAWDAFVRIMGRVFLGLCLAFASFLLVGAVHPIIGLIIGTGVMIAMVARRPRYGLWRGRCPHCQHTITVQPDTVPELFDCPSCRKRIYLAGRRFSPV